MTPEIVFLLTLIRNGYDLVEIALRFEDRNMLPYGVEEYPMEEDSQHFLLMRLPDYEQYGQIVKVEVIAGSYTATPAAVMQIKPKLLDLDLRTPSSSEKERDICIVAISKHQQMIPLDIKLHLTEEMYKQFTNIEVGMFVIVDQYRYAVRAIHMNYLCTTVVLKRCTSRQ